MPNVILRVTRYLLRSRKRSASLQNSTASTAPSALQVNVDPGTPEQDVAAPQNAKVQGPESRPKLEQSRNSNAENMSADSNKEKGEGVKARPAESTNLKSVVISKSKSKERKLSSANSLLDSSTVKLSTSTATPSTNVRTRRVLRELQVMMKSSRREDCPFEVSLVDESNIYEWDVRLFKVDETSELWRSMQQTETKFIDFRLTFPETFPFQPPFMRLVAPYLDNGFIMDGGAICMEILTSQGWSSAYTVESLLVQVASGLTQGGAVVSHKQKRKYNQMTRKRAEAEFRRICKIHSKYGWVSMEKEDA